MAPVFALEPPDEVATEEKLFITRRERNCLVNSSSVVMAFLTIFFVSSSAVGRFMSKLIKGLRRFPSMIRKHSTGILFFRYSGGSGINTAGAALALYMALILIRAEVGSPFQEIVPPLSIFSFLLIMF